MSLRSRLLLCFGVAALAPVSGSGQQPLSSAGETARAAFAHQDFRPLLEGAATVQLHLPGVGSSTPMSSAQATVALAGFTRRAEEVGVELGSARTVDHDYGYVELTRRFRLPGTQEVRSQRVLLGYRSLGGRWVVFEIRVVE